MLCLHHPHSTAPVGDAFDLHLHGYALGHLGNVRDDAYLAALYLQMFESFHGGAQGVGIDTKIYTYLAAME